MTKDELIIGLNELADINAELAQLNKDAGDRDVALVHRGRSGAFSTAADLVSQVKS